METVWRGEREEGKEVNYKWRGISSSAVCVGAVFLLQWGFVF